jgi:hypothetical protein
MCTLYMLLLEVDRQHAPAQLAKKGYRAHNSHMLMHQQLCAPAIHATCHRARQRDPRPIVLGSPAGIRPRRSVTSATRATYFHMPAQTPIVNWASTQMTAPTPVGPHIGPAHAHTAFARAAQSSALHFQHNKCPDNVLTQVRDTARQPTPPCR